MDFGEVLGKAWRIVWKHKILWIFGILAGCGSGGRGGGGGSGSGWQQSADEGSPFDPGTTAGIERFFEQAAQWISDNLWIIAVVILVILVLTALSLFLGTIGKIGLIRGTFQADGGAEKLQFGELFRGSLPYFWRVFLLSFLIGLAFLLIFIPLALFGVLTAGIGFICLIPLICVMIPALWAIGIIVQQANVAMVVEDRGLSDGVRRGWEVVKQNIGPLLVIWIITAVMGFVIGLVLALPALLIVVPAAIAMATSRSEFPVAMLSVAGLCFVIYLPVLMVAQGILTAYIESVWALTYLRLTRPAERKGSLQALPANA